MIQENTDESQDKDYEESFDEKLFDINRISIGKGFVNKEGNCRGPINREVGGEIKAKAVNTTHSCIRIEDCCKNC